MTLIDFTHKIPVLTTVLSAIFFVVLLRHWNAKGRPDYLFWWTFGVFSYGLGTITESWVGLFGWNETVFKAWYIFGALLGGFPLAQGSVFLMMKEGIARMMMWAVVSVILLASLAVVLSPVDYSLVEPHRLTGKVLVWKQIRWVTPFVNLYALFFLVGGAAYSSYRYSRNPVYRTRFFGNLMIALGGLLPGIGGSFTKFGYTEVLYVTELLGIVLIYIGYRFMRADKTLSIYASQRTVLG